MARGAALLPVRAALRRSGPAHLAPALSRARRLQADAADGGCRSRAAAEAQPARDAAFARGDERRALPQRRLCGAVLAQSLLHRCSITSACRRACSRASMGRKRPRRPRRASFAPRLIVMAKSPIGPGASSGGSRRASASTQPARLLSHLPCAHAAAARPRSALAHLARGLARQRYDARRIRPQADRAHAARGRRSRGAHAAPVPPPAAGAGDHRRQRYSGDHAKRDRSRLSPARQWRCGVRTRRRRRLLARWLAPYPASARAFRQRALVGPACACRHAAQSRRASRRLRGNARRCRLRGGLPRLARQWQRLIQPR